MVFQIIGGVVAIAAIIWVIYDVWSKQQSMPQNKKILWTVLGVLFNIVAAIVYYFVVVSKKK